MLVAIEGIDGCGKSTVAEMVQSRTNGLLLKFPNYLTPAGRIVQAQLESGFSTPQGALVHQCMQLMNRFEFIDALGNRDRLVICDRYLTSGKVYGRLEGVDPGWFELVSKTLPKPDLNVLLWMHPADCLQRVRARGGEDAYERRGEGWFNKVATAYADEWSAHLGDKAWLTVFGGNSETMADEVCKAIKEREQELRK